MAQTHHVYAITNQGKFAWENGWCFGFQPLNNLKRILQYEDNTEKENLRGYYRLTRKENYIEYRKALSAILCLDLERGKINDIYEITQKVKVTVGKYKGLDFTIPGNNDGITFIDLRTYPIKYCFLFFNSGSPNCKKLFEPLSAKEYFDLYKEDYKDSREPIKAQALITYINKHARVLTEKQLKKLFPLSMKVK